MARVGGASGDAHPWLPLPPGASKWNKIAYRMFCHLTQNWRGSGLKIPEAELTGCNRKSANFHGAWNDTLLPLQKRPRSTYFHVTP